MEQGTGCNEKCDVIPLWAPNRFGSCSSGCGHWPARLCFTQRGETEEGDHRGIVFPRCLVNHEFPERSYLSQFSGWNKFLAGRQLWENFGKSPKVKSSHVVLPAAQAFTRRKRSRDLPGEACGLVTTTGGEQSSRRQSERRQM